MNLKVSFSWIGLVIFALPMRHISPCRFILLLTFAKRKQNIEILIR